MQLDPPMMGRRSGLRRRAKVPVIGASRQQRPLLRNRDIGVGRRAARLEEADAQIWILAQARGEDATGGTGTHDEYIEIVVHPMNQSAK
jgi:hypothetical protein